MAIAHSFSPAFCRDRKGAYLLISLIARRAFGYLWLPIMSSVPALRLPSGNVLRHSSLPYEIYDRWLLFCGLVCASPPVAVRARACGVATTTSKAVRPT